MLIDPFSRDHHVLGKPAHRDGHHYQFYIVGILINFYLKNQYSLIDNERKDHFLWRNVVLWKIMLPELAL
jgi:hypothetical protein